jgi:hypothetical protein
VLSVAMIPVILELTSMSSSLASAKATDANEQRRSIRP